MPVPRSLLAVAFLEAAAVYGVRPMVSYEALNRGASTSQIGLIAASFGLFAFAAAIPVGRMADRFGGRRVAVAGTLMTAPALFLLTIGHNLLGLALGQAVLGVGQLMVVIGCQTTLTTLGGPGDRGRLIGTYAMGTSLGHALGPMAAGFVAGGDISTSGPTRAFLVAAALAVGGAIVAAGRFPADHRRLIGRGGKGFQAVAQMVGRTGMRQALIGSVVILAGMDILVAYLPVYGEAHGLSAQVIGFAVGGIYVGQLPPRLFLGSLIKRFGNVAVLVASMAIPAVIILVLLLGVGGVPLVAVMFLLGLNLGVGQPMTLILVSLASLPEYRGLAMSLRLVGNRLGQLTIPALVGAIAGPAGVSAIVIAIAVLLGGGSAVVGAHGKDSSNQPS